MSTFDTASFLNTAYTAATATAHIPVPEGVYTALTKQPEIKEGMKDGKPWYRLTVPMSIDSQEVRELLGREEVKMNFQVFLEVENGVLAQGPGRNVQLGRLREALGLNNEGEEFTLNMLGGKVCKVSVKHRAHPERQGEVIADIDEVGAFS